MEKMAVLLLAISGLHAMSLGPIRSQKAVPVEERRQGTQPSRRHLVDLRTGLVQDHISQMQRRIRDFYVPPTTDQFRQGTQNSQATLVDLNTGLVINPTGEMKRTYGYELSKHPKTSYIWKGSVSQPSPQGTPDCPPFCSPPPPIRNSEYLVQVRWALRGSKNVDCLGLPKDWVEKHFLYVPPSLDKFRQGTQISQAILVHPMTGETQDLAGEMQRGYWLNDKSRQQPQAAASEPACNGEVISGKCYLFFSSPQTFSEAEAICQSVSSTGHLASVTSPQLHSRLASMVTEANKGPTLTWLGGVVQADSQQWTDGSSWTYSDWMPGQPKAEKDQKQCLEMFKIGERWWSTANCSSKRAFICSYPAAA